MFNTLQLCRIAAGLLITLFHLGGAFSADKYFGATLLGRAFSFGHYTVVFFFVLSGFLITWLHMSDVGRPDRLFNFVRKRLTRIYPSYWIVFMAVYVPALLVPSLSGTVPHDFWVILKSLLLLPQNPAVVGGTGAPVLIAVWSLQYELVFYAVMACLIVNRWFGWSIVALLFGNVFVCNFATTCEFPASFFGSNYLLPFCFGAATALLARSALVIREPLRMAGLVVSVVCLLRGIEVMLGISLVSDADGMVVYGLLGAALILALVTAEQQGCIRVPRYAGILAGASYPLFLLHFPLISLLCKLALAMGVDSDLEVGVAFVLIFAACLGSALAFHLWIERPLLEWLSGKRQLRKLATAGAGELS